MDEGNAMNDGEFDDEDGDDDGGFLKDGDNDSDLEENSDSDGEFTKGNITPVERPRTI